jgi:hypothetical protein
VASTLMTRVRHRLTPAVWIWSFALASLAVVIGAWTVSKSYISHTALELNEPKRVAECRQGILAELRAAKTPLDLKSLAGVHGLCYAEVNEEDMLDDYGIRSSAYLNQQLQTTILLWMVVAITFSGVILAGVQLVAGYRLASAGKAGFDVGGSVGVEKDKLSVSSSVTGVLILAISLLFFYVFVHDVYLIKELVGHPPVNSYAGTPDLTTGWGATTAQAAASAPPPAQNPPPIQFVGGGLGPPPAKGGKSTAPPAILTQRP